MSDCYTNRFVKILSLGIFGLSTYALYKFIVCGPSEKYKSIHPRTRVDADKKDINIKTLFLNKNRAFINTNNNENKIQIEKVDKAHQTQPFVNYVDKFDQSTQTKVPTTDLTSYRNYKEDEDLSIPILLERDYGNFKDLCLQIDNLSSFYLNYLPDEFFNFNGIFTDFLAKLICDYSINAKNALVLGSGTGNIVFLLANFFQNVRGIEKSFSKIVISQQLQNLSGNSVFSYEFPLEGSHRTCPRCCKLDDYEKEISNNNGYKGTGQIHFLHHEPSSLPLNIGTYQLVVITNDITTWENPDEILSTVHKIVKENCLLVIYSDYNWERFTNKGTGFGNIKACTTFDIFLTTLSPHFDYLENTYLTEAIGKSLRKCCIYNYHVTVWLRKRNEYPS